MPRPDRHEALAIMERRKRVADAYVQGKTQHAIAALLGVSRQAVDRDLKAVRKEWLASAVRDFDQVKAEQLAKIDHIEAVAWEAWERSCRDAEERRAELTKGRVDKDGAPLPDLRRTSKTKRGQSGDPRFLDKVAWCVETRLKLIGALKGDAVAAPVVVTVVGGIDLEAVLGQRPGLHQHDFTPSSN